jgi:hypothetical protein
MCADANGSYKVFCDHILSSVVGKIKWRKHRAKTPLSNYATVSDEAFAILFLLQNSWDYWHQEAKKKGADEDNDEQAAGGTIQKKEVCFYTQNGPGTKRDGGWSNLGLEMYNTLAEMVYSNRNADVNKVFEKGYQRLWEEELFGRKHRLTRKPRVLEGTVANKSKHLLSLTMRKSQGRRMRRRAKRTTTMMTVTMMNETEWLCCATWRYMCAPLI